MVTPRHSTRTRSPACSAARQGWLRRWWGFLSVALLSTRASRRAQGRRCPSEWADRGASQHSAALWRSPLYVGGPGHAVAILGQSVGPDHQRFANRGAAGTPQSDVHMPPHIRKLLQKISSTYVVAVCDPTSHEACKPCWHRCIMCQMRLPSSLSAAYGTEAG